MTSILAVVGDTHSNSTIGVNPPEIGLDEGGTWLANKTNRWRWQCWNDFWDVNWNLKKELNAELFVVVNGDAVDDPFHATSEVVSKNKTTILESAANVFERPREMADHFLMTRGTVAHVGVGCWMEEALAKDLDAEPDEETGSYSWYHLPMMVERVYFDIAHHPKTTGRLPWTEGAAPNRQGVYTLVRKFNAGHTVPDVILRSHHHGDLTESGISTRPRTFFLRPWQMSTQYSHRIGESGVVVPIGGASFIVHGEDYSVRDIRFTPEERQPWRAE